ncbi:MAG: hypothetical protein M0Z42_07785 [Actinomycetota bacterium]|nr:hypothetical protein [Actinomycetota bacterium]
MARAGSAPRKQKPQPEPEQNPPRPPTKGTAARGRIDAPRQEAGAPGKGSLRQRMGERVMRIGFIRRRYVKRVIRYLDKSKKKGRRLPPAMMEMQRFLAQIPKEERARRLDEAIVAQQSGDEFNRDLRRAAANQQRRSGKGAGGYRPGAPPRSVAPGPRPSKKPR